MEKKKPVPQPPSSSEEESGAEEEDSGAEEEETEQQGFVRSDRRAQKVEDKRAAQQSDEESGSEEDGDEDEDDDDDGTQRSKAIEAFSSEVAKQNSHDEGDSDSDSETSSASEGKPSEPSHQFVVVPRKAENANGHSGKKASTSEKLSKSNFKPEASPKKGKEKDSKRNRDAAAASEAEKGSLKKQKKESSDLTAKSAERLPQTKDFVRVSKEKATNINDTEKRKGSKKSAHANINTEKPERAYTEETSAKKPEISSGKKAAEKGKSDKKAVKDADDEAAKGSLSPAKPKLFTGNDEIVLTSEILHDLQQGVDIPVKRNDGYWSELADRVHERMEGSWTKEQLCDKMKRMKTRYLSMTLKFKSDGKQKFRNSVDQELYAMWDEIWGNGDADDSADVKNKRSKALAVASPLKQVKASRDKVTAPVQDIKVVAEESEGHEGNEDLSESEESDGDHDLPKNDLTVSPMEVDLKDAKVDHTLGPETNADNTLSHSVGELQGVFHKEVRMTIAETLKEWESKVLAGVENAVKLVADQARMMNGLGGFDVLSMPLRTLDMRDLQPSEGDQALQQQWHELRLKELEVYCQRLELMQRECQLKQEQIKLQIPKRK